MTDNEVKKMVSAINNETKRELGNILFTKWLYLMLRKDLDPLVVGLCSLYCETVYSKLYGITITSVHDTFIGLKDNPDKTDLAKFRGII